MKKRMIRCGIIYALVGLDAMYLVDLKPEPWLTFAFLVMTTSNVVGATIGAFWPKFTRRWCYRVAPLTLLGMLIMFLGGIFTPDGLSRLLTMPWMMFASAQFVIGAHSDDDDEHVFDGASEDIQKLVESVRIVHGPQAVPA